MLRELAGEFCPTCGRQIAAPKKPNGRRGPSLKGKRNAALIIQLLTADQTWGAQSRVADQLGLTKNYVNQVWAKHRRDQKGAK